MQVNSNVYSDQGIIEAKLPARVLGPDDMGSPISRVSPEAKLVHREPRQHDMEGPDSKLVLEPGLSAQQVNQDQHEFCEVRGGKCVDLDDAAPHLHPLTTADTAPEPVAIEQVCGGIAALCICAMSCLLAGLCLRAVTAVRYEA